MVCEYEREKEKEAIKNIKDEIVNETVREICFLGLIFFLVVWPFR